MRKMKLVVITDSGVFTFMPKMIQIQESAKAKTRTSPKANNTPNTPPAGRKPRMSPSTMMRNDATE